MNTAIIVAAGSGKRFGSDTPKQFLEILGRPILSHTIAAFESARSIDNVILVVAADGRSTAQEILTQFPAPKVTTVVSGGKTRAESVQNGFAAVDKTSKVVAVHDAARPLVLASEIDNVVERAAERGAACLTSIVTDTIKQISGDTIVSTIDRNTLRRALTPQAFTYEILSEALAGNDLDHTATDECFLVEGLGRRVTFIDGSPHNIKITYPEDLVFAEAILSQRK